MAEEAWRRSWLDRPRQDCRLLEVLYQLVLITITTTVFMVPWAVNLPKIGCCVTFILVSSYQQGHWFVIFSDVIFFAFEYTATKHQILINQPHVCWKGWNPAKWNLPWNCILKWHMCMYACMPSLWMLTPFLVPLRWFAGLHPYTDYQITIPLVLNRAPSLEVLNVWMSPTLV